MKAYLGAALAAAVMVGCRPEISGEMSRVDLRGRVTGVIAASEEMRARKIAGFVRVEGTREPDTGYDKAALTVTDSTVVRIMDASGARTAAFGEIREGDSVEATFTGPVRESYPVQATAARITILSHR